VDRGRAGLDGKLNCLGRNGGSRHGKRAFGNGWLVLRDTERTIAMFLAVRMVVRRKKNAEVEAEKQGARNGKQPVASHVQNG
jgi:hypothetical protein